MSCFQLPDTFRWEINPTAKQIRDSLDVRAYAWNQLAGERQYTVNCLLDEWDDICRYVLILHKEKVIGSFRVTQHDSMNNFPVSFQSRSNQPKIDFPCGFCGRLTIDPTFRVWNIGVRAYSFATEIPKLMSLRSAAAVATRSHTRILRKLGWDLQGSCEPLFRRPDERKEAYFILYRQPTTDSQ